MPLISSIRTSIENKAVLVRDAHARRGTFLRNKKGDLMAFSGGFTVVYPYKVNNEKWGFRCWHADNMGGLRQRFEKISRALQSAQTSYLCDFVYVNEGICVDGKIYPTTRMRWIDGDNLKEYILKNLHSKDVLLRLATDFCSIIRGMHTLGFAHGDLQHENIIVEPNGNIVFIDYDSFYCPELKNEKDYIVGKENYQHPARKYNKITSAKIDYFSELIIYISILALAYNPQLAKKYNLENPDSTLFTASDYNDLRKSKVYSDIYKLGGEFHLLLQILEGYLTKSSINELEPFDYLLFQRNSSVTGRNQSVSGNSTSRAKTSQENECESHFPQILSFKSSKSSVERGETITISWKAKNFTKVLLNGEEVTNITSVQYIIQNPIDFILQVYNGSECVTVGSINSDF